MYVHSITLILSWGIYPPNWDTTKLLKMFTHLYYLIKYRYGIVYSKYIINQRYWKELLNCKLDDYDGGLESGFRRRSVLGRLRLREFLIRSRLRLLVKENIILEFLKTDYKVYKIRYTCPSTCRPYFMFTLKKTSNDVSSI